MTEQELINHFVQSPLFVSEFGNVTRTNTNCKSKKFADIEFHLENEKIRNHVWRIEAKVHTNQDRHNSVHKIFGELLKETGRETLDNHEVKYGVLISDIDFYRDRFSLIEVNRFIRFGELIPIECVFAWNGQEFVRHNWNDLHIGQLNN